MSKHTPGPWQLYAIDGLDIHEGPTLIATVSTWDVHDPDERAANAALIAAAPELLEILELVVDEAQFGGLDRYGDKIAPKTWELAEAAIARANGE